MQNAQPWVKWLINHNMKFVVYFVWFLVLPLFLFAYIENAVEDATKEFKDIQQLKKG